LNKVAAIRRRVVLILLSDIIGVVSSFYLIFYFRLGYPPELFSLEFVLIYTAIISTLFLLGTYFQGSSHELPTFPVRTFLKTLLSIFPCIVILYALGPEKFTTVFGRGILPFGIVLSGILATLSRYFINKTYYWRQNKAELLCLSASKEAAKFSKELNENDELRVITYSFSDSPKSQTKSDDSLKTCSLNDTMLSKWNEIVFLPGFTMTNEFARSLVGHRMSGTAVRSLTEFYEYHFYKVPVTSVGDDWFYLSQGFSALNSNVMQRIKRVFDIICSTVLLILGLPIIILASILIASTSKGPAFFVQSRVGLNSNLYNMYKLRTMYIDAERYGPKWAEANDSRVTFVGRMLRSSRIDELPQLWNVLKGDMSLIGPRPERPEFTGKLAQNIPYYELRHLVKPGLTGWAQVMYPYGASEEDSLKKLEYDLYYIKHQSFFFDINILVRTIMVVFQRKGR